MEVSFGPTGVAEPEDVDEGVGAIPRISAICTDDLEAIDLEAIARARCLET